MYCKLFVFCLFLVHKSNGQPLDVVKPAYDVKEFLAPRIVGGEEAPKGQAKHMVALIWENPGFRPSLICGGSIVSPKHVLTAAHCIDSFIIKGELMPELKGTIGSNYWNSENKITFSDFKLHPEYDYFTIKNDIGLLWSNDIKLNKNIAVAPVAFKRVEAPVMGTVFGWGRLGTWDTIPDRLQVINTTIITAEECQRAMDSVVGSIPPVNHTIELCTLRSFGYGMCNGDSGSAILVKKKLVGLVSWGFPCARGLPDVFVNVPFYLSFLKPHLEIFTDYY